MQPDPNQDGSVDKLIDRLKSVRQSHQDGTEEQLREALRQELGSALGSLSPDDNARILGAIKARLVSEARESERRLEALEREVASLRAERDSLAQENASLKAQPAAAAADPGATTGNVEKIRGGLLKIAETMEIPANIAGLPDPVQRLFHLIGELLLFALKYDIGLQGLLMDFEVGQEMGSRTWKRQQDLIGERFRSCLKDEKGSLETLKASLTRNSRFLVELNGAYLSSIDQGSRALLGKLDPEPILEENKGRLKMVNYEGAWKAFMNRHSDLCNLTRSEMWELFYWHPVQEKLGDLLGPAE